MFEGIITHTLALSLMFTPFTSPATPSASFTTNPVAQLEQVYIVNDGDTLASIAEKFYEDSGYWTTIWNDNDTIESPSLLEKGQKLSIRLKKPLLIEELTEENKAKMLLPEQYVQAASAEFVPETQTIVTPAPAPVTTTAGPLTMEQITYLGNCEAGMDPAKNTGNGYYGAFQFSYGTWKSMGTAYERADLAPLEVQIDAVQRLLQRSSIYTQFPGCARKMQSLGII